MRDQKQLEYDYILSNSTININNNTKFKIINSIPTSKQKILPSIARLGVGFGISKNFSNSKIHWFGRG